MYKFKDYFSRKELFYLGIDNEKEIECLSKTYVGDKKYEDIDLDMKNIYRFIKASQTKVSSNANMMKTAQQIFDNRVSNRIIAAFYDVGILEEKDLTRFPLDYTLDEPVKSQIEVMEAIEEASVCYEEIETNDLSRERKL